MYIEKDLVRGYNEYLSIDVNNGEGTMMDVGILMMEDGDTYSIHEPDKEVGWIALTGNLTARWGNDSAEIQRQDPFRSSTWCLHLCAGDSCTIEAHGHTEIYIQKTVNPKRFKSRMHRPEDTDTWHRGGPEECGGCTMRDVRTSFDYEIEPDSNMVLGETITRPGKWSSYPPHCHPQPEVYFYYFEKPVGFGAGWANGEVHEIHHHGLMVITEGTHAQAAAPGYPFAYTWGIRHLPENPWTKTRIDDPKHAWLYDPKAEYWGKDL